MQQNSYPQNSLVDLKIESINGKSRIDSIYCTMPFKILSPFYDSYISPYSNIDKRDRMSLSLISVGAGLFAGDLQNLSINVGDNSDFMLQSQSFEKIHDTKDGFAKRDSVIHIGENARLYYAPLPTIPFKSSSFYSDTNIYLCSSSVLYYRDIFACGRVGMMEKFVFRIFSTRLRIFMDNRLVFFDNMILEPDSMILDGLCAFGDFTHSLSFIIVDNKFDMDRFKHDLKPFQNSCKGLKIGITKLGMQNGYYLRALSNGSEKLLLLCDMLDRSA